MGLQRGYKGQRGGEALLRALKGPVRGESLDTHGPPVREGAL